MPGEPWKEGKVPLNIWIPADLAERVSEYQHQNRIESKAEAVRRLLQDRLDELGVTPPQVG